MDKTISIDGRSVGPQAPCFVIAEVGVNHNGDLELARQLVDVAARTGADAVKFQTFDPATLAAANAPKAEYQKRESDEGTQRDMLEKLVLSADAHRELKARAEGLGLVFFSSPFDERSVDFLDGLDVAAFKVPSGELTNHRYLQHVAQKHRPVLMSTGMATLAEVEDAVKIFSHHATPLALFHCVSSYPAAPADANLRCMDTLRARFGIPVGWSDHTEGTLLSCIAVARGADLIEKHLTLDHDLPGPDHKASMEPDEFIRLVRDIRTVGVALGDGVKRPTAAEAEIAQVARKSLFWRVDLPAGVVVVDEHLIALRPGTGISAARLFATLGMRTRVAVGAGHMVREDDTEGAV